MTKTPYGALNPINNLIDETLGENSGVYLLYCSDGVNESVDLEAGGSLYSSELHSPYDENDRPIDPEYWIAQQLVETISQLERVKAALLKKYPPKPPTEALVADDYGLEDVAAADAAAGQIAGQVLRRAGLVGKGLPS